MRREGGSFEIGGDIFSSPCVARNMIIIGSLNKSLLALDINGNLMWDFKLKEKFGPLLLLMEMNKYLWVLTMDLYCLNTDGTLQWRTKLNGKIRSSSPCISEHNNPMVFIGTHNGAIYCLNLCDGSIIWSKKTTKPVLSSPAVLKERVDFAASDNNVYCFDCNTGLEIWEFATDDKIWSSPVIGENDGVLFCGSLDSHIYGLDIKTGNQTWRFPTMNIIDFFSLPSQQYALCGRQRWFLYAFGPQYATPSHTM